MAGAREEESAVRSRILDVARELFAERGYEGASVRDIAAGAGVTGAMINYYFGSKEGLYRDVLASAAAAARELMLRAADASSSTRDRLTRFVRDYLRYILTDPNMARIVHRELIQGGDHLAFLIRKQRITNYEVMRGLIEDGVKRGELRDLDADLAPISLLGMMVIFQIASPIARTVLGKADFDEAFLDRIANHTVDLFLEGAASRKR